MPKKRKNPAAVALGRKGGAARAKVLSPARLSQIGAMGGRASAKAKAARKARRA